MHRTNAQQLYCGLDVHRTGSSYAAIVDELGNLLHERKIPNDSIVEFIASKHPTKIAMEASSLITSLYRKLTKDGYDVFVSHPTKTRLIAESRIKTDRVDARALAELLRLDALPASYMPDESLASLREMVRRRAYLVKERSKFRVKVRDCLAYNGIEVKLEDGLFTKKGIEWLESLQLDPIDTYLRLIRALDVEILALSRTLRQMAPQDEDVTLLMTVPGIGYYSVLLIKSEVGSINRSPDGEHLLLLCWIGPICEIIGESSEIWFHNQAGIAMVEVDYG